MSQNSSGRSSFNCGKSRENKLRTDHDFRNSKLGIGKCQNDKAGVFDLSPAQAGPTRAGEWRSQSSFARSSSS